jgi:hypothetical protein
VNGAKYHGLWKDDL